MWPAVEQFVEALRGDGHNPIHALDARLLVAIERRPPSTVDDLATAPTLRAGPRRGDPELTREQVARWLRDATERGLIAASAAAATDRDPATGTDSAVGAAAVTGAGSPPRWSLTGRGRERAAAFTTVKARAGAVLGWALRMPSRWERAVERLRRQEEVGTADPPPGRVGLPPIARSPGDRDTSPEQALENLRQVDHIVVLMLENRSFDHMLGYLDLLDGQTEVDGLTGARPNRHDGTDHMPRYLASTAFPKSMDPPHGRAEIAKQIAGGAMDGFVESFARCNDVPDPGLVMGYHSHRELPVYDHLAHRFLVCDRWFSSVPSATWPNRLFALAGTCDPERSGLFDGDERFYDLPSFVRLLEDEDSVDTWRWYSWDPGSLRFADGRYRADKSELFHHDHFRRVAQHSIEPGSVRDTSGDVEIRLGTGLLEDAANGDLPRVSWIDPNFVDLSILDANSNDDHPPSDVRAGQELVMMVYRALAASPCWERTLLVVTYDEHGGFYDHAPPPAPPEDDPPFPTYGVRVPALVVSPLVEPGTVSHTVFDHASLTRTILERFGVEGAVARMADGGAPRVARAEHLGRLLTRRPAPGEPPPDLSLPSAALEAWRHGRAKRQSAAAPEIADRSRPGGERWEPEAVTGFPADYLEGARALRGDGLPPGHP